MLIPPPPSPPNQTKQVLAELAGYYRQLIEYYQRRVEKATEQLFHVEALLKPMLINKSKVYEATIHQAIVKTLEANFGKILHIDYLIWELYGRSDATGLEPIFTKDGDLVAEIEDGENLKLFSSPESVPGGSDLISPENEAFR